MDHATTPLTLDRDELSLAKSAVIGVLAGMVFWALLGTVAVRVGWPQESWGFAVTIGAFAGLWGGPFFGSAAGIAAHQLKVEAREKAEAEAHAPARIDPTPRAAGGVTPASIPTV